MPNPNSFYTRGSRVITLSAIPEDAPCPIEAPESALIEVIQISDPVDFESHQDAVHVMFVYETETEMTEHHAIVPLDWYMSQFPLRLLATIPESIEGIESTSALKEGPVEFRSEDEDEG